MEERGNLEHESREITKAKFSHGNANKRKEIWYDSSSRRNLSNLTWKC